jgi:hypothetical protein
VTEQEQQLLAHFRDLALPPEAQAFLLKLWRVIQFLDDVVDGHTPCFDSIFTTLIELPSDPFYAAFRDPLTAVMVTQYYKWQAANQAERLRQASAKSYMWRAGYYDVVLYVCALCLPREQVEEQAAAVMAAYGETLEDYMKEQGNA